MKSAKMLASVLAVAVAGMVSISVARADEAQAKTLLKAMSDYLAAQKAISFDYDSNLELVSTQQQKIGLASSGTLTLNRPDKIHLIRTGGFANVEMVFDGKTLTLLGKNANLYTQVDAPGTIDQLVDVLRDKYHRTAPAADLLMSDPYKELMPLVTDVKDLGSGVIHGTSRLDEQGVANLALEAQSLCAVVIMTMLKAEGIDIPDVAGVHFKQLSPDIATDLAGSGMLKVVAPDVGQSPLED